MAKLSARRRRLRTGDQHTLPTSIRQYLDEGDLADLSGPYVGWLAELVVFDRRHYGFDALGDRVRSRVDDEDETTQAAIAICREVGDEARAQELAENTEQSKLFERWAAELVADEALCERVEEALPGDLVAQHLGNFDAERRPYRLTVEHRGAWVSGDAHAQPAQPGPLQC